MEQLAQPTGTDAESSTTVRLLRAYHERGDTAARQRLVELYLPLVEALVRRQRHDADDDEDLFQVGCIGLINAIDRFDRDRGAELAAFAVPTIAGEIRNYLRDRAGVVRLPRRVAELRAAANSAHADLTARLGRTPTAAEVAAELRADEDDVALALEASRVTNTVELDPDERPGESASDAAEDRLFLMDAFRDLDEGERRIVYLRFVRDMPASDVARELGLSQRQVSRAAQRALARLRAGLENPAKRLPGPARKPKMGSMGVPAQAVPDTRSQTGYHIELVRRGEPDAGWTASVEELPGCEAAGATPDEAVRGAEAAIERWIADALEKHREIPKPRSAASHSGRLMLRMPQSLHAELARAAQSEEVSLNQLITGLLAAAVGWHSGDPAKDAALGATGGRLRLALVANLIVLAVVGIVALILLIVALT